MLAYVITRVWHYDNSTLNFTRLLSLGLSMKDSSHLLPIKYAQYFEVFNFIKGKKTKTKTIRICATTLEDYKTQLAKLPQEVPCFEIRQYAPRFTDDVKPEERRHIDKLTNVLIAKLSHQHKIKIFTKEKISFSGKKVGFISNLTDSNFFTINYILTVKYNGKEIPVLGNFYTHDLTFDDLTLRSKALSRVLKAIQTGKYTLLPSVKIQGSPHQQSIKGIITKIHITPAYISPPSPWPIQKFLKALECAIQKSPYLAQITGLEQFDTSLAKRINALPHIHQPPKDTQPHLGSKKRAPKTKPVTHRPNIKTSSFYFYALCIGMICLGGTAYSMSHPLIGMGSIVLAGVTWYSQQIRNALKAKGSSQCTTGKTIVLNKIVSNQSTQEAFTAGLNSRSWSGYARSFLSLSSYLHPKAYLSGLAISEDPTFDKARTQYLTSLKPPKNKRP